MKLYYPIALKLKGKDVLVVGGGQVAERKVKNLIKFDPELRIVSPNLTAVLKKLLKRRKIKWVNRAVKSSDVKGAYIVIAATSQSAINQKISQWAKKQGIWVNVVDKAQISTFISPAVFSTSRAVVAVYTHGKDPVLSRDLKNFLKEKWNDFLSYRDRL